MMQASVTVLVGWMCICSSGLVTAVHGYFMCDYNNMTDYCGWSNVFGNDKNWTWAQGPDLAHGITSLENGHNYDGSARVSGYLFISDRTIGRATIRMDNITDVGPGCLVFWRFMFGTPDAKGELKVDVTGGTSLRSISDMNDTWLCETVELNQGTPFTLEFVASINEPERIAIAIDDVKILNHACTPNECDASSPTTEPMSTSYTTNTSSLAHTDVRTTPNPIVQPTTVKPTVPPVGIDLLPIVLAVIAGVLLMTVVIVVIVWYFRWRKRPRKPPIVRENPIRDIMPVEEEEEIYTSINDATISDIAPKQNGIRTQKGDHSAGEYVGLPPTGNGVVQRDSDIKDEYDYIDGDVPRKNDDYLQPSGNTRPASDRPNTYLQLSEQTRPVSNSNDDYLQPSGDMRPVSDLSGDYLPMSENMGPLSESTDDYVQPSGDMRPMSPGSHGGDYLSASGHMVHLSDIDYDVPRRMHNDSTDERFDFTTLTRQQYPGGYDFTQSASDSVELPAAGDLGVAYTPQPYTG